MNECAWLLVGFLLGPRVLQVALIGLGCALGLIEDALAYLGKGGET